MPLTYNITPDAEGRGAWTLTGGLLPVSPTSTNRRVGYYRLNAKGETAVGAAWVARTDTSDAARCVNLAVQWKQRVFGLTGTQVDGWWGPMTDKVARLKQAQLGVAVDGIFGPASMRALLAPLVVATAKAFQVPEWALGGIAAKESNLDPAAVGSTTPYDHGLVQLNLSPTAHGRTVALEQAMDPEYALNWAGTELREAHDRWKGISLADPWDVAVLNHNSPRNAGLLARTGNFPTAQARRYVYGGTYTTAAGVERTEVGVRTAWSAT